MSVGAAESAAEKFELERIEECDVEEARQASPIPVLKHLDTRDSLVSNDSDISLSGDAELSDKQTSPEDAHMADNDTSESGSDDNASSNEKDSGCEVTTDQAAEEGEKGGAADEEEAPFVPPDDETVNKIVAQVEFYFSDANITKDAFLLKHVRRNKEGYVSLKLISSFKRVKHLAKDWRTVAYALERSTKLEVNEARTKLRRVDPLPAFDQTTPSRTVVAVNIPTEKSTIESVAELFRPCGEIALIRILRPGSQIPSDVRSFANKHPEMNGCLSALIEFDRTESAKLAVERQDQDWRNSVKGMKVIELNAPASADKKKRPQNKKTLSVKGQEQEMSSSCQSGSEAEHDSKFRQRRSSSPNVYKPGDLLHRRYSSVRDPEFLCRDQYRERLPCSCCGHCERRYSSSGSGYDSPTPSGFRRYSMTRDHPEAGYQVPSMRRHSGVESPCCMSLRRCSRDSGSESSGSFTRPHELTRRFSRDSLSGSESGVLRRFSRDSISSEGSANFRRYSRDSVGSDVFAPPFLSRNSSRDLIEVSRRPSFGSVPGCADHHVLAHTGSRSSFSLQSPCVSACPPHVPENVVRMPKGPDGSKGFGGAA